jgi:hypothetical protein
MNRRSFLKVSGAVLGARMLSGATLLAADAPPAALRISPGPQLFLDEFLIESQSNLQRVINPPLRMPEPVITGKEDGNFQPYVSVIRDPASRKFRMWYGTPAKAGVASPSHLATMESDDGIHWKRPHQVLADPDGLEVRFGASVMDEGASFADPQKRYKFAWFCGDGVTPPVGGLMVATSPDGLTWKRISEASAVLPHNHDINGIFRDPIRKRYGTIVSMLVSEPSHYRHRRLTFQSVSDDLIHWSTPWPVLVPDEHDQPNTEFYAMSGIQARGELLVGLVKVLRDDLPADPGGPAQGIGYTTLAYSRDGISWVRDREPFMQRNLSAGTWDHAMTWADCQTPVDDEVFIYYGGYARGHKVERFTERQIGMARMKRDRYVARRAGREPATLRTKPLLIAGSKLTVNADVRGEMKLRALGDGVNFKPATIAGDSMAHRVEWDLKPIAQTPLRLEITLRDADLFALEVQ